MIEFVNGGLSPIFGGVAELRVKDRWGNVVKATTPTASFFRPPFSVAPSIRWVGHDGQSEPDCVLGGVK